MSARPKLAARKAVDDWAKFRPIEVTRRRQPRSAGPKLLILTFLTVVFVLSWVFFKLPIRQAASEIKRAIYELRQERVASGKGRSSAPAARREQRSIRSPRPESAYDAARVPGPFDVYLLDGDRYIRVDSSSRSVLLNLRTGETTWLDSDAGAEARK